jgi:glycosyltransferase involved in cell wall biosynthesis
MPLFSVVIPTYNRRERLLRAVASVHAQTFTDYELIVVDDGSSDGTVEALAKVQGPVTAIRQANRGPAAARSAGVRAATGGLRGRLRATPKP